MESWSKHLKTTFSAVTTLPGGQAVRWQLSNTSTKVLLEASIEASTFVPHAGSASLARRSSTGGQLSLRARILSSSEVNMTTTTELITQGSLKLQPERGVRKDPEAWKAMVGKKQVSARFELLPKTQPKWVPWEPAW